MRKTKHITLCDFCNRYAVAASSSGEPESRRARCKDHRVLGGEMWPEAMTGRRMENDWLRSARLNLDADVMPAIRDGVTLK